MSKIDLPDSEIYFSESYLSAEDAARLYDKMNAYPYWKRRDIKIFGKVCKENRETCFFGNEGMYYKYSGRDNAGIAFPEELIKLKKKIEKDFNYQPFNFALANKYPDGSYNIGMHSDDERDLCGPIGVPWTRTFLRL